MRNLVEKFIAVEKEIAEEKGGFTLFALFLREGSPDRWDVVVSAPWFGNDEKSVLDYLVMKLQSHLAPEELIKLSRIVVLEPDNPGVKDVNKAVNVEHGRVEMFDVDFFGLDIEHAYIITSDQKALIDASR